MKPLDDYPERFTRFSSLLTRTLIIDYLLAQGFLWSDLEQLPNSRADQLLCDAERFAFRKLDETPSKAFLDQQFRVTFSRN